MEGLREDSPAWQKLCPCYLEEQFLVAGQVSHVAVEEPVAAAVAAVVVAEVVVLFVSASFPLQKKVI